MKDNTTTPLRARELRRLSETQREVEQSQQSEYQAEKGPHPLGYGHGDRQEFFRGYQEQPWRTSRYQNECVGQDRVGYYDRYHRPHGWDGRHQQNFGYVNDPWQMLADNRYPVAHKWMGNQFVPGELEEEDEFEKFRKGPFSKK